MKKKSLPAWIKNPGLMELLQSPLAVTLSAWFFQGMLYMNRYELILKLLLDIFLTVCIGFIIPFAGFMSWFLAWLIAHTVNAIFNFQPIAVMRHMGVGETDPKHFIDYVSRMHDRINEKAFLQGAASYGSLSRGMFKKTTDLDIRFLMVPGIVNGVRASNFAFVERVRALLHRFPLDLYAFTLPELLSKMRRDEIPVVFYDPDGLIQRSYKEVLPFEVFRKSFVEKYDPQK